MSPAHGAQRSAGNPEGQLESPGGTIESFLLGRQPILLQEQSPLLRKITPSVVFSLIPDIRFGALEHRRADAGSRIARLPFEPPLSEILITPLRRARLDELHGFGQRHRLGNGNQNMRVIVGPADRDRRDPILPRNARHESQRRGCSSTGMILARFFVLKTQWTRLATWDSGMAATIVRQPSLPGLRFLPPASRHFASLHAGLITIAPPALKRRRASFLRAPVGRLSPDRGGAPVKVPICGQRRAKIGLS